MTSDDVTIGMLCDLTGESLPEGYELRVSMTHGCLDVTLWGPDGNLIEVEDGDDPELPAMMLARVNKARDLDGLQPVNWDNEHDPDF